MVNTTKRTSFSVQAVASQLGRNRSTVFRWTRRDDWGFGRGPWSKATLKEITTWASALQEDRAAGEGADPEYTRRVQVAKCKLLERRLEKLSIEKQILERTRVDRAEIESARAKEWGEVRRALQQVPRALRQALADTSDPDECERILTGALQTVCNGF